MAHADEGGGDQESGERGAASHARRVAGASGPRQGNWYHDAVKLEEVFGSGGALARVLPGWEPRAPQSAMADGVARALEREEQLVVEAGTGVGKSLAYLIPAALWAVRNARRVIVSTHTRALQEQLRSTAIFPSSRRVLGELGLPLKYSTCSWARIIIYASSA